jgi:fibronectin type 3 domain-containing protein
MHNSLPHIFETVMPSIFLTFMLSIATCSRVVENQKSTEPQINEQMQEDLIHLEYQREELHLQQQEMIDRLREIERQVENER